MSDSGSSDKTCAIAEKLGAKVEYQEWLGFGKQKDKAVQLASHDWVFVLDADKRITPELATEIKNVLVKPDADAYRVARLNYYFGEIIKTCGLYPDYSVRLFNKHKAEFSKVAVHESVQVKGETAKLKYPLIHLAYNTVEEFITKQNHYSSLSDKRPNKVKALLNPYWTFINLYFIKLGFLSGWRGFIIAKLYAQYTFWKYIK